MGGDPLESRETRTAVGPTGLEGGPVGEDRRLTGPGVPFGIRYGVGQARSRDAAPTSLSDTH